jgi:dihydropteroate synthase
MSSMLARSWQLRTRTLSVGKIPLLMGVVNVTPDSFSDGGRFFDPAAAVEQGIRLAAEGADLLDIGGESTRPGAEPVSADEELRRVLPVVASLCEQTEVPVSIDTSKAAVAGEALAAGAEVINDVTALTADPEMPALVAESGCGVCAMHMQGTPQTMHLQPTYEDVVEEVLAYLQSRRNALLAVGIQQSRIALDPGIGFGKDTEHNLTVLRNIARFHSLGCPLVVGPSRKRFIGHVLGDPNADRTAGTIGVCLAMARKGVQMLRVHDVAAARQALLLFDAAGGGVAEKLADEWGDPTYAPRGGFV